MYIVLVYYNLVKIKVRTLPRKIEGWAMETWHKANMTMRLTQKTWPRNFPLRGRIALGMSMLTDKHTTVLEDFPKQEIVTRTEWAFLAKINRN